MQTFSLRSLTALAALAMPVAAQGYDYQAAAAYSEQRNGHALLVAIGGQIVFERYANGWSANMPHRLASGTKSFSGVLLAMAIEEGLISSFDEKLVLAIPEWQNDPIKSEVTYRQLIGLQSGITGGPTGLQVSYAQAISAPTIAPPGQVFSYGPIPYQIFGEALKRKLVPQNESVADYIQRKLLNPLGMVVAQWTDWGIGEPRLPGGAGMIAREWLKFGELVRQGGVYNGNRLVGQALMDECFQPSPANANYGVSWWLPNRGSSEPDDLVSAQGSGKQRLMVIRSHDMVIVRLGDSQTWLNERFVEELMPAAFAPYGRGCAGTAGVPLLDAAAGSRPRIGTRFDVELTNMRAANPGVLWVGASKDTLLGLPLPIDLGSIGAPMCMLLTSMEVAVPLLNLGSSTVIELPIPNDKTLASYAIYLQAASMDASANTLGIIVSNGGAARIGVR